MKKAAFKGSAKDFRVFLKAMAGWLGHGYVAFHQWQGSRSQGFAQVEAKDFMKEAV